MEGIQLQGIGKQPKRRQYVFSLSLPRPILGGSQSQEIPLKFNINGHLDSTMYCLYVLRLRILRPQQTLLFQLAQQ